MKRAVASWLGIASVGASLAIVIGCQDQGRSGEVSDEAMRAGRSVESFPAADEDYFHDMDGGALQASAPQWRGISPR